MRRLGEIMGALAAVFGRWQEVAQDLSDAGEVTTVCARRSATPTVRPSLGRCRVPGP